MFLSLFALDVFGKGYGFWKTVPALAIHLVPVYIVVAVLAIAWLEDTKYKMLIKVDLNGMALSL